MVVDSKQIPPEFPHYVPPHRRTGDDTDSLEVDADDDQTDRDTPIPNQGKVLLAIDDIHQVYQDLQTASHGDQKLNLPKFNDESNGDTFMD